MSSADGLCLQIKDRRKGFKDLNDPFFHTFFKSLFIDKIYKNTRALIN